MRLTPNRIALLICLYAVALALWYAAETPIFEAPDEGAHFLYVHNLLETGELPVLEGRDEVFRSGAVQRHHPPLYYLVGAALVSWTERDDVQNFLQRNPFGAIGFVSENNQNIYLHRFSSPGDTYTAVWVMRGYSIALSVGTLWLVYRAGKMAFPGQPVGLAAMMLVVSIPGFLASAGSINNDNLVTFLFAAGVTLVLRMWRRKVISGLDIALLSLILPAAALAKLTGLALFPLVYAGAAWGAVRGYYSWRRVGLLVLVTLAAGALLGGWWYARNWQLYGDPLALRATLNIWARGYAVSEGLSEILFEAKGVWDSFWMTLGHFNIRGPEWFYGYVPLLTLLGLIGLVVAGWRNRTLSAQRMAMYEGLGLLLLTCLGVIAALVMATRQINVSQGRILYPMLVGFAPLLALGWRSLLGRWGLLLVVPMAVITLATPLAYLDEAYDGADLVSRLPAEATPVNARAETLTLLGYDLISDTVTADGVVEVDVYFSGRHAANPLLFVKALDPMTQETLGGVDTYPGMSPTNELREDVIYRARIDFPLDPELAEGRAPMQLQLAVGWRVPGTDPGTGRFLRWRDANDTPLDILLMEGPTLVDFAEPDPTLEDETAVTFGDAIRLGGFTVSERAEAGEPLSVTLEWEAVAPMTADYTLTLGLVDAAGALVAQADGMLPGYPTSAWQVGDAFSDERAIAIPADLPPGAYRVYVGWYSTPDIVRLPARGTSVQDNLFYLPQTVEVVAP